MEEGAGWGTGPTETISPLAGFQVITTSLRKKKRKKREKKLATGSTRLASINPGLFFINLITLLLKTFAKTVMMGRIWEEAWDTGIRPSTVFRDGRSFQLQKKRPKRKCQKNPCILHFGQQGRPKSKFHWLTLH